MREELLAMKKDMETKGAGSGLDNSYMSTLVGNVNKQEEVGIKHSTPGSPVMLLSGKR